MSRRSSRKVAIVPEYTEVEEETIISTPRGRGKKVKTEVVSQASPTKSTPKKSVKTEVITQTVVASAESKSTKSTPVKKTVKKEEIKIEPTPTSTKTKTTKRKVEATIDNNEVPAENEKKAKKPRKSKAEKEEEMAPLAARTAVSSLKRAMYIGAHVSGAGGVDKSVNNAIQIGANAFALFLKSQRKWVSPPLANEARDAFKSLSTEHGFDAAKHVLPHGSYLVNLAAADAEKAEQAYDCFLDDLKRCDELGIRLYNFHPGNTNGNPRSEAIARIAKQLNRAHKETKSAITVLENMAGQGNTIGSTFEDLRDVIALVDDKSRVGVCIDTCHSFAAGYDLRTPDAFSKTMDKFKTVVGQEYLKAVHLNDSKAPFESHRDLHANIGTGFLGLRAFHNIVNSPIFDGLPMVLETPIDRKGEDGKSVEDKSVWAKEIKLLESLVGMDTESEEFKSEEKRLWDIGTSERTKFQGQADKKKEKGQKTLDALFKKSAKAKGQKKKKEDDSSGEESEGGCSH